MNDESYLSESVSMNNSQKQGPLDLQTMVPAALTTYKHLLNCRLLICKISDACLSKYAY